MVTVGATLGFAEVEEYPDGLLAHEYVLPVTAAAPIDADFPEQMAVLDPAAATGRAFTVTVTLLDKLQPVEVIVSVRV